MLRSRCVLPVLVLQLLLEQTCSAAVPSRIQREVDWLDRDLSPRQDAGSAQAGGSVLVPDSVLDTPELSVQVQNPRKNTQKRRKLSPLDSIGGFLMSRYRSRQDEPDLHWKK